MSYLIICGKEHLVAFHCPVPSWLPARFLRFETLFVPYFSKKPHCCNSQAVFPWKFLDAHIFPARCHQQGQQRDCRNVDWS